MLPLMPLTDRHFAQKQATVTYAPEIENEIALLVEAIEHIPTLASSYPPRWLAVQLLEQDEPIRQKVQAYAHGSDIEHVLQGSLARLHERYGEDVDMLLTSQRYSFVHALTHEVVTRPETTTATATLSDRIDRIVTHQLFGIPIFLAMMWLVFKLTTDVVNPLIDWIDVVISGPVTRWAVVLLDAIGLGGTWLESLLVNGILAGVGGVLVFIPVLVSLYLALAILEDSGYMARAAFVMHRLMQKLGLHGKSFLPMIVGFGCTVPALYATRTLENERDRILTALLVPFMSCGGRLPVYVLMATIFFPHNGGLVIFALYMIGILVAIVLGMILSRTLFQSQEYTPFIMEMSPYRLPTLKNVWFYTWERLSAFIQGAATVIMIGSIVIWLLGAIPTTRAGSFAKTELDHSVFGAIASTIAPVFSYQGFGNQEASGALISGIAAKEMIISTMSQIYGLAEDEQVARSTDFGADVRDIVSSFGDAVFDMVRSIPLVIGINLFDATEEAQPSSLMTTIQRGFDHSSNGHGTLAAFAFMVFVLLYTPCMPSIAAERQELGSKWMWVSVAGQFALAWLVSLLIFQGGLMLGIG
jgi:ferrous iron transport protein B